MNSKELANLFWKSTQAKAEEPSQRLERFRLVWRATALSLGFEFKGQTGMAKLMGMCAETFARG